MTQGNNRWPRWSENASKGDLIRSVIYLEGMVASLASVVSAMRSGDEKSAQERMQKYFRAYDELQQIRNEIGGE